MPAGARAISTRSGSQALKEVGPSVFFSLLVIAVAFLPVFTLVDQEGRLFSPLAYTKNLAMAIAAVLGHHARPGPADAVHADGLRHTSGRAGSPGLSTRSRSADTTPRSSTRSAACSSRLRAGVPLRAAPPKHDHRRRAPDVAHHHPRLLPARASEFMPPSVRGLAALHAHDRAGHLGDRGPATPAEPWTSDPDVVPGSRTRLRQGGPGGDLDRSRALLDDGNHDRAEATDRSGGKERWYSNWAPDWLQGAFAARLARSHYPPTN